MVQLSALGANPPEHIELIQDAASGLKGVIVVHSTALGQAAGGCRLWRYGDDAALVGDALRLAEGMSYKNALAGLPLGGGKAVLQLPSGDFDRRKLFEAFGRAVAGLGGGYVAAEDVGTTVADMSAVRSVTRHVAGLANEPGRPGGDPSPWTARGVFLAMEVAAERRFGRSLSDMTVAVQGLGNVGFALCGLLNEAGARLIVADPRGDVAAKAACRFDAYIMEKSAILEAKADIFAPCALGGILDRATIPRLNAKLVCGGANNQLATPDDGDRLKAAGILYAPDYVVNAGGIINVAAEYLGWTHHEVVARVDLIGERLEDLFNLADVKGVATNHAADGMARALIASGGHANRPPSPPDERHAQSNIAR